MLKDTILIPDGSYQQVTVRDGQEQLNKGLQGVVQGIIAVQTEDTEVDIVAAQYSFQHGETNGDSLQFQCINLIFWHLTQCQDPIPLKQKKR